MHATVLCINDKHARCLFDQTLEDLHAHFIPAWSKKSINGLVIDFCRNCQPINSIRFVSESVFYGRHLDKGYRGIVAGEDEYERDYKEFIRTMLENNTKGEVI